MSFISAPSTTIQVKSTTDSVPVAKVLKAIDLSDISNGSNTRTPEQKKLFDNFKTLLGDPPSPQTLTVISQWFQDQLQSSEFSLPRFNFVSNAMSALAPVQTAEILTAILKKDLPNVTDVLEAVEVLYNNEPSFFKTTPLHTAKLKELITAHSGQDIAQKAGLLLQKQSPRELSEYIKGLISNKSNDREAVDEVICSVYKYLSNSDKALAAVYLRESIEVAPVPLRKLSDRLSEIDRKDQAFLAADVERIFGKYLSNKSLETMKAIPPTLRPFFGFFAEYGIKDASLLSHFEQAFKGGNEVLGYAPKILKASNPEHFCKLIEDEAIRRLHRHSSQIAINDSALMSFVAENSKNRELLLEIVLTDNNFKQKANEEDLIAALRMLSTERADNRIIPLLEKSLDQKTSGQSFLSAIENLTEFAMHGQYVASEAVLKKLISIAVSKDEKAADALDGIRLLSNYPKVRTTLLNYLKDNSEVKQALLPLLYIIGDKKVIDDLHANFKKLSKQHQHEVLLYSQSYADKKFISQAQDIIHNAHSLDELTNAAIMYLDQAGAPIDKTKLLRLSEQRSLRSWEFEPQLIQILAKVGGDEARPLIFAMLNDSNVEVRAQAVATLSSMGIVSPKITQRFQEQVTANPEFAALHLRTAMKLQSTEAIVAMLKNIEDPESHNCRHALDDALADGKLRKDFFEYLKRRMPAIEKASPQAAHVATQLLEHYTSALQLGMHHPLRMPLSLLSTMIEERKTINEIDTRPRAVLIMPRSDHNGAFYFHPQGIETLFKNYKVMVFEVGDDRGMQTALQAAAAKAPIDFLSLGGHGAYNMLSFGSSDPRLHDVSNGPQVLDLKDEMHLGKSLKQIMAKDSLVFLQSCSVGYGENIPGMSNNIANSVRRILGPDPSAILSGTAPLEASSIHYIFDKDGRILNITFNVPSYHASISDSPM